MEKSMATNRKRNSEGAGKLSSRQLVLSQYHEAYISINLYLNPAYIKLSYRKRHHYYWQPADEPLDENLRSIRYFLVKVNKFSRDVIGASSISRKRAWQNAADAVEKEIMTELAS